ncbi:hypothetical protein Neosp_012887 [[Neocosmospora] mangrovei]
MPKEISTTIHGETIDVERIVETSVGQEIREQARGGAEAEHNLAPLEAIRKYPWTLFWCLVVSILAGHSCECCSVGASYWDCFEGFKLRRTEIACMVFAGQIFTGLNFAYNSTYFFQQIGLDPTTTYHLNVGGTGMGLFVTLMCWIFVMPYVGRRTAYL